jgi:hypothetical protein
LGTDRFDLVCVLMVLSVAGCADTERSLGEW